MPISNNYIATSSSWLNMGERRFREVAERRIRRESFASVPDLIAALTEYVENDNQNPTVFVWSATVANVLAKIANCGEARLGFHA